MAKVEKKLRPKGSLVYEIIIVVLIGVLVGTILVPKHVWEKVERETQICRHRMERIQDAELLYIGWANDYSDTLEKVIDFVKSSDYFLTDTVAAALRDSFYVRLIRDYLVDYEDLIPKQALDSAFSLYEHREYRDTILVDSTWVDTTLVDTMVMHLVYRMLDSLYTCPTVHRPYSFTLWDTGGVKSIDISCPITDDDIQKAQSNFWFSVIGGGELKNHGQLKGGEASWKKEEE